MICNRKTSEDNKIKSRKLFLSFSFLIFLSASKFVVPPNIPYTLVGLPEWDFLTCLMEEQKNWTYFNEIYLFQCISDYMSISTCLWLLLQVLVDTWFFSVMKLWIYFNSIFFSTFRFMLDALAEWPTDRPIDYTYDGLLSSNLSSNNFSWQMSVYVIFKRVASNLKIHFLYLTSTALAAWISTYIEICAPGKPFIYEYW